MPFPGVKKEYVVSYRYYYFIVELYTYSWVIIFEYV